MYFPIYLLFAMLSSITYHQFIQLTFYRFYPSIQRTIHSYPSTSYHPSTPVLNHPWLVTNYSFILHKFKVFIIACPRPPSLHSNLQGVKKTHRIICSFRCLVRCRESRGSNFSLSSQVSPPLLRSATPAGPSQTCFEGTFTILFVSIWDNIL